MLLFVPLGFSQSTTSLRGNVTDASGAVIAGAAVTLTHAATGAVRKGTSSSDGFYEFSLLPPGIYDLTVSAAGFNSVGRAGIELLVSVPATVNLQMGVAGLEQQIEVTGNAPLVNTTDASLGAAFNQNQVSQLPIEARNVVQLLSLQPGVTFLGDRPNAFTDTRSGSVNGSRSDQSNVTLDGVDVNDQNNGFA